MDLLALFADLAEAVRGVIRDRAEKLDKKQRLELRKALRVMEFDAATIRTLAQKSPKEFGYAAIRLRDSDQAVARALDTVSKFVDDEAVALRIQSDAALLKYKKTELRQVVADALVSGRTVELADQIAAFNEMLRKFDDEISGVRV